MKVLFMCGYFPDLAGVYDAWPLDYQDAFSFCRAVRTGQFERNFSVHTQKDPVRVCASNVGVARRAFGRFIERRITEETSWPSPVLVPMPSEDAVIGVGTFRSWFMLNEAMAPTEFKLSPVDALFWREKPSPQVLTAGRDELSTLTKDLICDFPLRGQTVVLVDDLVSSGTTLLAARDCLQREGAAVLGAVVCGKVIHDRKTPAFGRQEFWVDDDGTADPS
ncbi:phosphoribosyltransferase [Beijerinckia indica]|uniref:Phosphoribosyltransferase domain-containing protein n=1 Tax=Beijerinckia indica subsp. indica (strain ATCC 9039 / DSM 1715 / NCIMB 8712) TaxID=395963 RepID=B2IF71_BEII9|nr:phosphoribosyltransferase [Beijerinckia indica]ACB95636.1 hypothetical protein Bind_2014 [Beijerinckia indica subsp. indica ATCC 9039]